MSREQIALSSQQKRRDVSYDASLFYQRTSVAELVEAPNFAFDRLRHQSTLTLTY